LVLSIIRTVLPGPLEYELSRFHCNLILRWAVLRLTFSSFLTDKMIENPVPLFRWGDGEIKRTEICGSVPMPGSS